CCQERVHMVRKSPLPAGFSLSFPKRSCSLSLCRKATPGGHNSMPTDLDTEVAGLGRLTLTALRRRYAEVFEDGSSPPSNKVWMTCRIAWRLQAPAEVDLSERAGWRAADLASDANLRLCKPRLSREPTPSATEPVCDRRLPRAGTTIVREYKG